METTDNLTLEFTAWCKANNLPLMSADELLYEVAETATRDQNQYISEFIERWHEAQAAEDAKADAEEARYQAYRDRDIDGSW